MRPCIAVVLTVLALPAGARAQEWSVEAHAGRVRAALDPTAARQETALLGVRYDGPLAAFRLSAGIPTGSAVPLWGAASAARRLELRRGPWSGGIDLSGHGYVLHDRDPAGHVITDILGRPVRRVEQSLSGFAGAVQAMPGIGVRAGRLEARARAGISHYSSRLGDLELDRSVRLGDAQLTFTPQAPIALTAAVRHYEAADSGFTYAGVTAAAARGRASVWGTVGQWLEAGTDVPWAAGAALRVHERTTLTISARHDALDPLYLTPPQTGWSVGALVRLGARAAPAAPVPAAYVNGVATIRLPAAHAAGTPKIAGDFNSWKPESMQRSGDGWTYMARIQPGVYNYAFVNEGGEWFVPEKHPGRRADGMGGHVAVLVVQ